MKDLVKFQANNKFLFMAYNQKEFRIMGRIVANHEKKPPAQVYSDYESHLHGALSKTPRYASYINVLMHAMGHFKDKLSKGEKAFFLDLMEKYRSGRTPLRSDPGSSVPNCSRRRSMRSTTPSTPPTRLTAATTANRICIRSSSRSPNRRGTITWSAAVTMTTRTTFAPAIGQRRSLASGLL